MKQQNVISHSHVLIVPSYNTGPLLLVTLAEIVQKWLPVWVVIDGSDDGSEALLEPLQHQYPDTLVVIKLEENSGKGAAILTGITQAQKQGYTHVLTMDADHQHSAEFIEQFMQTSSENPAAMILGEPIFDASAPMIRVKGRKISNGWANLETLWAGIHDSLFGMRVYPIADLMAVMHSIRWARRFDFEPEIAVRLAWRGVAIINIPTPVRYIAKEEGVISQFKYGRDNILLIGMHIRLFCGFIWQLPCLLLRMKNKHSQ